MKRFLIATHGRFADGVLSSLRMILGDAEGVETMNAFTEDGFDLAAAVKERVERIGEGEELVVLTDMFGGSVNNEFMRYLGRENYHLIAGVNLPLLLELVVNRDADTEEMIADALRSASGAIQYCNAALAQFKTENGADTGEAGI
ncbi:MAG: PTS fructose transporter subunit IIA [Clostridiales Family XIII bacterium]|nr:PTS fructose transporter subunit IIA [Clostridiales Family XIII bacterium]